MISTTGRDRRTVLMGVGVVTVLLALSRGVPAWKSWRTSHDAKMTKLRERVAFTRDARRLIPALRDSLGARRARLTSLDERIIVAATPALAAAMLGALVERMADSANLKVSSLDLRGDSVVHAAATTVSVRLSGEGDVVGLQAFLQGVDAHSQPMVVRELSVSQSDPVSPDDRPELLRFDFRIEGAAVMRADGDARLRTPQHAFHSAIVGSARAAPTFAEHDPFRFSRRPARVRYSVAPTSLVAAVPTPFHDPRPTMTLRAIAGGPPWHALIDGVPGHPQPTLVQPGTVLQRLVVRRVTRDTVVIRDPDTTWVLTLPRPR